MIRKSMCYNVKVNIGNFYCRRQVGWIIVAMAAQEIDKLMGALAQAKGCGDVYVFCYSMFSLRS